MRSEGGYSFLRSARFERLLAAVLLTTTGPGELSQWLSLASAVYFLAGLISFMWRVRWLFILGIRVARGMPGPRARRRALCTFAARLCTTPQHTGAPPTLPDVIIASSMRSGGTWASHIAHQIRMKGTPPDFFWQEDVVPWLDIHQDLFGIPSHQHPQPMVPRIFRSTASYTDLVEAGVIRADPGSQPRPSDCKVVFIFRDMCDVCYSLFFYFPALFQVHSVLITLEDFVWCARALLVDHAMWNLVHFWRRRHDPNVLFLFFDDLFSDCSETGAIRRMSELITGSSQITQELFEQVQEQTRHAVMSNDDNWDRFSGMSVAVLISERLGVGYRYELEPYLGKVSRIGGKSGQGRRVLGEAMREIFDQRWRAVVTAELGFANLQEMQAFRQEELRSAAGSRKLHRSGGVGKGGGAGSSDGPPEKGGSRQ